MEETEERTLRGLLAKLHDEQTQAGLLEPPEEEEEDWFNRAREEVKMMDIALKQLQNYSISGERPDIIQDNAQDVKLTFSSLTAQRFKIGKKELDDSIAYLHFAKQFTDEHPEDAVSKDLKGAILFIQQYLKEMNIEAPEEYGYPAKYGYPYRKYYQAKEETELLHVPYDRLSKYDVVPKMQAHSRRAARLISAMAGVREEEEPEENFETIHLKRLTEALEKLRERRESKSKHEQELSKTDDFPEALRLARMKQGQELSKPEEEFYKTERRLKEVSRRERARLGIHVEE